MRISDWSSDVCSSDLTEFEAGRPAFDDAGPSLAALARRHGGVSVIANGSLDDPDRAAAFLAKGDADLISLARGALANPDWVARVRLGTPPAALAPATLRPLATLDNAQPFLHR